MTASLLILAASVLLVFGLVAGSNVLLVSSVVASLLVAVGMVIRARQATDDSRADSR